ncbi:MAG: FUSC family protein [Pseudomonadota bacterium]
MPESLYSTERHRPMLTRFMHAIEIQPRLAVVSATSVCLASIAAFAMDLGAPWWAAISAWIVAHADTERWWAKSTQRVFASILGSFGGYQLMIWTESDPFLQALCIFSLGTIGIYKRLTSPEYSYAWLLGTLTALVVMLSGIEDISSLYDKAVERAVEVSVGVIVAGMVTGIFAQWKQPKKPPAQPQSSSSDDYPIDRQAYFWILAIAGGISLTLAPVISGLFQLPGLTQFAITIGVCLNGQSYQIRHVGHQRVLGCLLGGIAGIILLGLSIQSLILFELLIFAFIFVISGVHYGDPRRSAIGTQAGVAFMISALAASGPVEGIQPVVDRLVGMLCALVILTLITLILEWIYTHYAKPERKKSTGKTLAGNPDILSEAD